MGWKNTEMFDRVYGQGEDEHEAMADIAADVLARVGIGAGGNSGETQADPRVSEHIGATHLN